MILKNILNLAILQLLDILIKVSDNNLDNNCYEQNNNNNKQHKLILMINIIFELKVKGQTQKIKKYFNKKIQI